MDGDKFISTNKNIPHMSSSADDNNFFLQQESGSVPKMQTEPFRHINDYAVVVLFDDRYADTKYSKYYCYISEYLDYPLLSDEIKFRCLMFSLESAISTSSFAGVTL